MPLDYQNIDIEMVGGLDEFSAKTLLAPMSADEITNWIPDKIGRLEKRGAFSYMTRTVIPKDAKDPVALLDIKSIFSTGDQLQVMNRDFILTYLDETNGWDERGRSPLGTMRTFEVEGRQKQQGVCQMVTMGDYIVMAWQENQVTSLGATDHPEVWVKVVHLNGDVHIPAFRIGTKTLSPCVVTLERDSSETYNDYVLVTWLEYSGTIEGNTTATIKGKTWQEGDVSFSATRNYETAVRIDGTYPYRRHYDVVNIGDANPICVFAFIQFSTDDVYATRWNVITPSQTHSQVVSTVSDHSAVAIATDETLDRVIVAFGTDLSAGLNYVGCTHLTHSGLSLGTSATVLTDEAVTVDVTSLGIEHGLVAGRRCSFVAATFRGEFSASTASYVTKYNTFDTGGNAGTVERELWNTLLLVQPFINNSHCYIGLMNSQKEAGFSHPFVTDLNNVSDNVWLEPTMVAAWDIGSGWSKNHQDTEGLTSGDPGTPCTAYVTSLDKVYFSTEKMVELLDEEARLSVQRVEIDIRGKIIPAKFGENSAIIPGSVCAWFDGVSCFELGWTSPPYLEISLQAGGNTDTYNFQGHMVYVDTNGLIHRGPPSPVVSSSLTSQTAFFNYTTTSATMRNDDESDDYPNFVSYISYFSDSNDEFLRRHTPPAMLIGNRYTVAPDTDSELAGTFAVAGSRGAPIYTFGNADFPPINPGACTAAAVVRDRVFLGGFHYADRIKYSDSISPLAGGSNKFAPEFSDILSFESQESQEITAISSAEDRVIFWTEDATYAIVGDGPDKAGRGSNYSGIIQINSEYGCSNPSSVVQYPGGIFFESKQGLCRLDAGSSQVSYIGNGKDRFRDHTCVAAVHSPELKIVFFVFNTALVGKSILCYSYDTDIWHTWTSEAISSAPVDACLHQGNLYVALSSSVVKYTPGVFIDGEVGDEEFSIVSSWKSPWISMSGSKAGWQRLGHVMPLIHRNGDSFDLKVDVFFDFEEDTAGFTKTETAAEMALYPNTDLCDPKIHVSERCRAFKVKLTDITTNGTTRQGGSLERLSMSVGVKKGTFKGSPDQRG